MAAVLAHGLLNRLSTIIGTATTLREHWSDLDDDERASLLERLEGHAVLLAPAVRKIAGA